MISRLLVFLIASSLSAQMFPFPGGSNSGPPPSYSGPGDIVSGAMAWWGLRAYSLAKAGTKAANICNASDATCADVNTLANGNFDVATAQGSPLNCGGAGGTCTVKKLYDQSGQTLCTSTTPCDIFNLTIANRPILTFSCIGSLPCMTWGSTAFLYPSIGLTSTQNQPYSISTVGERTGSFGSFADIAAGGSSNPQIGFANSTNTALLYCGSVTTKAATDSVMHSIQGTCNGASSVISVDGSNSTVSAGSGTLPANNVVNMGKNNNGLTGLSMEAGFWASDISASFGALSSNQHSYWGF